MDRSQSSDVHGTRTRARERFSLREIGSREHVELGEGLERGGSGFYHSECYACPVGSAFAAMREVRPEAVDRLLAAATEFVGAARATVEALAGETRRESRRAKVEKIDLE